MNSDRSSSTEFWLALLELGKTEQERQHNWNTYCRFQFESDVGRLIADKDPSGFWKKLGARDPTLKTADKFNSFAEQYGGHPQLPESSSESLKSFMDFRESELDKRVDFSGRVFIGANFKNQSFEQGCDFSGTVFLGYTDFGKLKSRGPGTGNQDGLKFTESSFHGTAHFIDAEIKSWAGFDSATFHGLAHFQRAKFLKAGDDKSSDKSSASFRQARFKGNANFKNAEFEISANFSEAEFRGSSDFSEAEFRNTATFNNAKFGNTTSFRGASFDKPPKFFETEIHEDVNFNKVDWSGAERSYSRLHRRNAKPDSIVEDAESAARAWDRLALIMSQRERLIERHEFFRLKMRAQRQRDGFWPPSSIASLLFDWLSDYGWGIGRAFSWWIIHIAAVGFILAVLASKCSSGSISAWRHVLRFLPDGLSLSFANSHVFLGLASGEGWLHDSRDAIVDSCESGLLLNYIGLFQAVLGPVLLFLVLLTLRNRFRLG